MQSVYLSTAHPRLLLRSEPDIRAAAEGGFLAENHFLELKSEISPGKSANRETARDLASLGVDGGIRPVSRSATNDEIRQPVLEHLTEVDGKPKPGVDLVLSRAIVGKLCDQIKTFVIWHEE